MKEIVEKWNGGAKRHEGIGKAMSVQDKLIQSPEEQAKEDRESEELTQHLENERLAKEPEERVKELVIKVEEIGKLERELEVLEVSKKYVERVKELVEQQLAKEAEERRKLMQEKIREDLENYKNPVGELGRLKTFGELSKESFEKLTCAFVGSSIERDISDKHSITDLLKEWELNNKQLFEVLHPYDNPVLDTFVGLEASGELASEEI